MIMALNDRPNVQTVMQAQNAGYSHGEVSRMVRSGQITCETCQNRTYQDGSDEMVSFKSPTHISPESAASAVMAHEQEHVSNAYSKANKDNGKVIQASVRIQTSVCPECGRTYVSGGETTTQIKYQEDNPYGQNFKKADATNTTGQNLDLSIDAF